VEGGIAIAATTGDPIHRTREIEIEIEITSERARERERERTRGRVQRQKRKNCDGRISTKSSYFQSRSRSLR